MNTTTPVVDNREYKYVGGKEVWQAIEARKHFGGLYHGYRLGVDQGRVRVAC